MKAKEFHRFVFQEPFVPVRITLVSGESYVARHPDYVHHVHDWGIIYDEKSRLPLLFNVKNVVSIRYLSNGNGRRRQR